MNIDVFSTHFDYYHIILILFSYGFCTVFTEKPSISTQMLICFDVSLILNGNPRYERTLQIPFFE